MGRADMKYQTILKFTLSPAGPVLVSSGSANKLHPELPDHTFLMSRNLGEETFVIPGSSLKGVIKHYLYRISENDEQVERLLGNPPEADARKSRVSVADAFADMATVQTTLRHSTAIGAVSQSAKSGSLNNMMAVIAGDFAAGIRMKDVTEAEILMMLRALQAIEQQEICIGGKISRGFGRMRIKDFQMTVSCGYDANLHPVIAGEFDSLTTAATAVRSGVLHTEGVAE